MGKSGKKWEKLGKVGKNGEKWLKVAIVVCGVLFMWLKVVL